MLALSLVVAAPIETINLDSISIRLHLRSVLGS
jgi:hypothetical protein